jgi:membrane associated rhomboid family serine protease
MREASVGFQCPDCVAEGRRTVRPARTAFGGSQAGAAGYVTISLIAVNVIVLVIGTMMSGLGSLFSGGLFSGVSRIHLLGAVLGPSFDANFTDGMPAGVTLGEHFTGIYDGAVYRLLTAMFIHYGPLHLLMNMWALWVLGRVLEAALGPLRFLAIYLLAGLGGSVAALLFSPNVPTAGASGAIFGLFVVLFLVLKRLGRSTSTVVPVIVLNLILTFSVANISIAGHLGGLVTGALLGLGVAYAPRQARTAVQVATFSGVGLILALLVGYVIATS